MESKPKVLTEKYEIGRLLGQGTYGKVYYGRNLRTSQSVAVKVLDKDKIFRGGLINQILREISVMTIVTHPNIVQLFEVMATKTKIFFILEYAKGGELFNKVAKGRLRENAARKYFKQLINAVDFCHGRGVYHRDIKPENLLLDENGNLKISDFGLSALADSKHQDGLLHTKCGTPAYVAPEVLSIRGYDGAKADIWSCGVVLFVLLASYLPFHDQNLMVLYRKIGNAEYECPDWFAPEVKELLKKMLDPNPETRISMDKIKENSWFRKALISKGKEARTESPESTSMDASTSGPSEDSSIATGEQESAHPPSLNAFDIISLSKGFDLSGLFGDKLHLREVRFTSREPAPVIISKLEEMGKHLKFKVKKKDEGLLKFEGIQVGRKGIISIDAEIFEVTPSFHLIELKKSDGDTMEYHKMLEDEIRPALHDIIWVWQGKQQDGQHLPLQQPEQLLL